MADTNKRYRDNVFRYYSVWIKNWCQNATR